MKKVLISRQGAAGDIIHASHLPRLLKDQGWDYVGFSTGFKGQQLLANNPFIDKIHFFEPGGRDLPPNYFHRRLDVIALEYDKVIDLLHSVEVSKLSLEEQNMYYQHQSLRDIDNDENYVDIATRIAGYPELCGKYRPEVFYTAEEESIAKKTMDKYQGFKVLINLSGSGPHKVFIQAKEVVAKIKEKYPDAIVFTTGAKNTQYLDIEGCVSWVGKLPFRQVLLMAKYMNCVIGCESGMMCGATMWDVPTIQLMTAASIKNHCALAKNDYSLQSPARCSPCYKGPYKYFGCPKRNNLPLCVYFDVNKIMEQVDRIYNAN